MSKKTFISNRELSFTQKLQVSFPRGVIPDEILDYWDNCNPDILRTVLTDAFYFAKNQQDPYIEVRSPIPLKLPHNENFDGYFYFEQNLLASRYLFDVCDVSKIRANEFGLNMPDVLDSIKNSSNEENQLGMSELWAIYLRGYDFFLKYFAGGIVYATKSAFYVNKDIYVLGLRAESGKLSLSWYSSWGNLSEGDFILLLFKS